MKPPGNYSIKDVEKLSGIQAHTIRIWEKRFGIIEPTRTDTNLRLYNNDDLKQLLNISLLNKNGFKISAIAGMSITERVDQLLNLSRLESNDEGVDENLLLSLIEMDELKFNQVFINVVKKAGFEKTFMEVIFPFFERIGIMWQTSSIDPAQEHFFSNMVRQKLIAATDALEIQSNIKIQKVLLFLPENELHEIGLLFCNYSFKARGYQTIYLGQSVPIADIERVINTHKPDLVVTSVSSTLSSISIKQFLTQLSALIPVNKIYYTGFLPDAIDEEISKNNLTVKDLRLFLNI